MQRPLWVLAALSAISPASAFDFELDKQAYLPGEPLGINCIWPAEPPEDASWMQFISYPQGTDDAGMVPRSQIHYREAYRTKDCVELRAPWRPGDYTLKAVMDDRPIAQKPLKVVDLPAAEILEFVAVEDWDLLGTGRDGRYFVYDLEFAADRCYPNNNYWGDGLQPILAFVANRDTGEIARRRERIFPSGRDECLKDCEASPIKHACKPSGTYRRGLRVPPAAGRWDLVFGQRILQGQTCGDDCIKVPNPNNEEDVQHYRTLARVPTVDPPDVRSIYFTSDSEGVTRIDSDVIEERDFYVWVEFVDFNPFSRETVELSSTTYNLQVSSIDVQWVRDSRFRSELISSSAIFKK